MAKPTQGQSSVVTSKSKQEILGELQEILQPNLGPSVTLKVELAQDGSIKDVQVKDTEKYEIDPAYRQAADKAIESVLSTSPWDVPKGVSYKQWRFFETRLSITDLIGEK